MEDSVKNTFISISFLLLSFAFILNVIGVYLLVKVKAESSNQILLLINLSVIKTIISITEILLNVLEIYEKEESRSYEIADILNAGLYGVNDMVVLILTIDRLLAVVFSIQYNIRVTRNVLKFSIVGAWLIGSAGITPFFFIAYDLLYEIFYKIVFLTLDGLVLVTALITYGFILKRLLQRRDIFQRHSQQSPSFLKQYDQFFYVSSLIIFSFILFVFIPDTVYVIMVIINENTNPYIESATGITWNVYLVTDALIYIFLQKSIRQQLKRLCRRSRVAPETKRTLEYECGASSGISEVRKD